MDLKREVAAIVLGGGRGTRLYPLTSVRAKPAVAFGGRYRLVDIPISNCLHSGIDRIFVLTQFQSHSLNRHIARTYRFEGLGGGFIEVLAAQQADAAAGIPPGGWYEGTADAVRRNLNEFLQLPAREYLILGGDQLYRMDFGALIRAHRESGADVTVAVTPVTREAAGAFGIMRLAPDRRIVEFVEKPKDPALLDHLAAAGLGGGKTHVGSTGIYVIRRDLLAELVTPQEAQDFGKNVIPAALERLRVQAYVFDGYWEDIGTVAAYYREVLAMTEAAPAFDLFNPERPVYTRSRYLPPTRMLGRVALERSLIADGCILRDCTIVHSVIGIRSRIGPGAEVRDSIIQGADWYDDPVRPGQRPGIGEGAVIRGAIVDKNVRVGKGARIVNEKRLEDGDGPGWHIRDGVVCIPKDAVIPEGAVI